MTFPPAAERTGEVDGLQNERTALAWVRTSLSVLGVGVLLAKSLGSVPLLAAASIVLAAGVGGALHLSSDRTRRRRAGALARGEAIVSPMPLLATAAATVTLAAVAAAVILLAR